MAYYDEIIFVHNVTHKSVADYDSVRVDVVYVCGVPGSLFMMG